MNKYEPVLIKNTESELYTEWVPTAPESKIKLSKIGNSIFVKLNILLILSVIRAAMFLRAKTIISVITNENTILITPLSSVYLSVQKLLNISNSKTKTNSDKKKESKLIIFSLNNPTIPEKSELYSLK